MKKYLLEIVVFICGAVVMILEIVGSRLMAPFLGTSIIVWTSLIGIILGALSLGYWWGGRVADRNPSYEKFAFIIFSAGLFIGLIFFVQSQFLAFVQLNISNLYIGTIFATIILFGVPSILLGMVSPYAVRLKLENLKTSGATVGSLYAISTMGSIVGTFSAGFLLIPFIGSISIILFLSIVLLMTSLLLSRKRVLMKLLVIFFLLVCSIFHIFFSNHYYLDVDTRYNRVFIFETEYPKDNRPIRALIFSPQGIQSAMYLDSEDLVFDYTKFYRLDRYFNQNIDNSLMIGGAGYSYPKNFLKSFPEAELDVVEIDPELTELAKEYFNLKENKRLNIYHEDARTFLNRANTKYDTIYIDAFSSHISIPFHLTTIETVQKVHEALNNDGVVLVNIISSLEGRGSEFLQAEYLTYNEVFPQVYLFKVDEESEPNDVQNIMLVALKSNNIPDFKSSDAEINKYLSNLWQGELKIDVPILTDNYAPVDYYNTKLSI